MAHEMNDEQRLKALEAFNPAEHLVQIKAKDGSLKDYYPAAWRLYELNLRYPDANFSTEVLFFDMEHDFAIVKARLYLGPDYDVSHKKAEALKQGKLSQLDKLDTAAKARCARDMGIGTEYALEFSEEDLITGQAPTAEVLATIKAEVKELGLARNPQQWQAFKKQVIGRDLPDGKLTAGHIGKLTGAIAKHKSNQAA